MLVFMIISLFAVSAYASNPINVVDNLGYLSDSEIAELQSRIDEIKSTYNLDTVIVITDNTNGKSSMAYADDYYDYNDYGLDDKYSGLLMLINMQDREVWISTTGRAIDMYDKKNSNMVDRVSSPLSNGNYFDACNRFIDDIIRYADTSYLNKVSSMLRYWPVYIIPLIISIAATLIISYSSKGKVTTTSRTYEEGGSFILSQNTDQYIRETTTRTKIQSQSSGGSGTHRGSSGRSHGGGGGKF